MPSKAQEARVKKYVARWKSRMLIDNWGVVIQYPQKDRPYADDDPKPVLADMTPNPRYTDTTLNIYPAFFKESVDRQEAVIVHELAHINTNAISDVMCRAVNKGAISEKKWQDLKEDLTEQVCKMLFKAYRKRGKRDKYIL